MDGTPSNDENLKDAHTVDDNGKIVPVKGVTTKNLISSGFEDIINAMTNTGSKEGELNAVSVHEAQHTTSENYKAAPAEVEPDAFKAEEKSRKEYVKSIKD